MSMGPCYDAYYEPLVLLRGAVTAGDAGEGLCLHEHANAGNTTY